MVGKEHFNSYKGQNDDQAIIDVLKLLEHSRNKEIHGAESHDGQYVRTEHDERVSCYGQDGRYAIQCKENVGQLYNNKCHEEGGRRRDTHTFYKKIVAVYRCGNREYFFELLKN